MTRAAISADELALITEIRQRVTAAMQSGGDPEQLIDYLTRALVAAESDLAQRELSASEREATVAVRFRDADERDREAAARSADIHRRESDLKLAVARLREVLGQIR